MRLAMSLRIVKAFAEYYIRERLGLKDHVYLMTLVEYRDSHATRSARHAGES